MKSFTSYYKMGKETICFNEGCNCYIGSPATASEISFTAPSEEAARQYCMNDLHDAANRRQRRGCTDKKIKRI